MEAHRERQVKYERVSIEVSRRDCLLTSQNDLRSMKLMLKSSVAVEVEALLAI